MTSWRALTIQSGVTRQIGTSDSLTVGTGIDADTGSLTIGANTTTSIVLGQNTSMTGTSTFSTGTGPVSLNGDTTVASGKALTVTSGATTLHGALTQDTGAVSLTANGASSFTTSAGALTLTSAAAATWSTAAGALTVDSAAALNLGNGTATSVSISKTGVTTTVNGALTVTQATTLTALGTTGVVHNNASGLLSTSLIVDADVSNTAAIAVSKLASGTAGQFLIENAGGTAPTWTSISGDVTASIGTPGDLTVVALQGNPVDSTHLTSTQDGYVATWNNTSGHITFESPASSLVVTLTGDVSGPSNANVVDKINGTSVLANPADATVLVSQGSNVSQWHALSQDATMTDQGVVTVVSAHGNFDVGVGSTSTLTIDGAGNFTTGTGTNTFKGNVTTSGAPNFDFSSSSGTFKTSSGPNTLTGATTASSTLTSTGLLTASSSLTVTSGNITTPLTHYGTVQVDGSGVLTSTSGTSGQLLISQGASAPSTWNTVSGDGTLSASGVLTVTQAAANFEVKGNLTVDGAETIIGTSTFQSNASFDGDVTIVDGYYLQTEFIQSDGYLNINAANGINLQSAGVTYLEVGTTASGTNFIAVPSGITLQAQTGGQIIATSSSGTTDLTVSVTAAGFTVGQLGYVSAAGTLSKAKADSVTTAYVFGVAPTSNPTTTSFIAGTMKIALDAGTYNPGDRLYLSDATAGQATNVAPSTSGHVVAPIGLYFDAAATVSSGDATKTSLLQVLTPVVL
jgi:hypothetical protein